MVSFVFERLRILVISSVAGRERVPCVSAESMGTGSKRELEKLSGAIREIKKRIKSEFLQSKVVLATCRKVIIRCCGKKEERFGCGVDSF